MDVRDNKIIIWIMVVGTLAIIAALFLLDGRL